MGRKGVFNYFGNGKIRSEAKLYAFARESYIYSGNAKHLCVNATALSETEFCHISHFSHLRVLLGSVHITLTRVKYILQKAVFEK